MSFLALPPELRNEILGLALKHDKPLDLWPQRYVREYLGEREKPPATYKDAYNWVAAERPLYEVEDAREEWGPSIDRNLASEIVSAYISHYELTARWHDDDDEMDFFTKTGLYPFGWFVRDQQDLLFIRKTLLLDF